MGYVSNIILNIRRYDSDEDEVVDEINKIIMEESGGKNLGFFSLTDSDLHKERWYNGCKSLEYNLYLGVFNYLSGDDVAKLLLENFTWNLYDFIQMWVCDEEDECFRTINVVGDGS